MCSSSQGDKPFNITWLKDQRIIFTRNSNKQPADSGPGPDSDYGTWRTNDQTSQYYVDNTIHINEYAPFSSILSIENLTSSHNGNYTCRISNQGGTVDHTAVLSVAGSYKDFEEISLFHTIVKLNLNHTFFPDIFAHTHTFNCFHAQNKNVWKYL